jgi:hypothetical protein
MKIYISHSREFDYLENLYKPIKDLGLNSDHEFFLPHENEKSHNTKDGIKNSDLIIAETSFPSTGQGIELGWAETFGKPILCIHKEDIDISGSLKYITDKFISYKDTEDLIIKIKKFLSEVN